MTKFFTLVSTALLLVGCSNAPEISKDQIYTPPSEKDLQRTDFPPAVSFSCPEHTQSVYGYRCNSNQTFICKDRLCFEWQDVNCQEDREFFTMCVDKYEYPGINQFPEKVSLEEAKNICLARDGHLCSAKEWQNSCQGNLKSPHGTSSFSKVNDCNFSIPHKAGSHPECRNAHGVIDIIGNGAEWQAEGTIGYATCVDSIAAKEDKNSFRCCYTANTK